MAEEMGGCGRVEVPPSPYMYCVPLSLAHSETTICNTRERGGSGAKSILRLLNNLSGYTGSIEATGVVWEIVLAMANGTMRIGLKRGLKKRDNGKGG